jgi:hypothetical protein
MSFHKRDRFGRLKDPAAVYASWKEARANRQIPPGHSWSHFNAAWRKKNRKKKIARLSRRKNRR